MKLFNASRLNANPDGTFKDNDTANGIIGTLINASIFNQLGYEIDNLINEAGLTPDENTLTQIRDSIKILITNADTKLEEKLTELINALDSKIDALKAGNIAYVDTTTQLGASNVQQAIEKIDKWIDSQNIVADGNEYRTGRVYNNKPVYYRAWDRIEITGGTILVSNFFDIVDVLVDCNNIQEWWTGGVNWHYLTAAYKSGGSVMLYNNTDKALKTESNSGNYASYPFISYTKKNDNRSL